MARARHWPPRGHPSPYSRAGRSRRSALRPAEAAATGIVRTALCTEVREGPAGTFLCRRCSAWRTISSRFYAIETTADELAQPVVIEGYEPPRDPRLSLLQITPDPGVIEVNVHPASNWDELVQTTTTLYDEARQARLGTEKFLVDGTAHRHGPGGNHVTLGGPTPEDSPLLRRPSLLKSLITMWQNHPSLSYLFSGLFIGPTARLRAWTRRGEDALIEFETALAQIPDGDDPVPPWLLDRVLRHHLVDLTGNTHRAEFCIDKLYSPTRPPAAVACSSSAPSRCRRTRA